MKTLTLLLLLGGVWRLEASGYVQGAYNATTTSSVAVAFPSDNASGNTLLAYAALQEPFCCNVAGLSISDTQGNTWTRLTEASGGSNGAWYCTNCKAGANTVTITYGYGSQRIAAAIAEWSGLGSLDASAELEIGATTITDSVTTTQAGDIIIGLGMSEGEYVVGEADASGWNTDFSQAGFSAQGFSVGLGIFDMTAGAAGSYSLTTEGTWTGGGNPDPYAGANWLYLLAFKSAAQPPVARHRVQ